MNRIKEVLEEKGIKQTWLAEKIGKSFSQTNAYVCNRRQPSIELLYEIASLLATAASTPRPRHCFETRCSDTG